MKPRAVLFHFLAVCILLSFPAFTATHVVSPDGNGDYPNIQMAVDWALDGDVIELTDGTFTGDLNHNITFFGKNLTVRSQSGVAEQCVIDVQGQLNEVNERGFVFEGGEGPGAVVRDLTVINAVADAC